MTHRRVPIGILWLMIELIPGINVCSIIAFFYFGRVGNRIAVRSGRFTDETTFVAVQNAWRNWSFGALAISMLLGLFSGIIALNSNVSHDTIGALGSASAAPSATDTPSPEATAEPSQKPETISNGSTVGGLQYTISNVSLQSFVQSFGEAKRAAGEFLVLTVSVSNVGSKGADISASDFHLKSGGTEYDEDTSVTVDGEFFLEKLNPGTTKSGVLIFDVPAGTRASKYALEVFGNGSEGSQESGLINL
jgi:hypothetical protein